MASLGGTLISLFPPQSPEGPAVFFSVCLYVAFLQASLVDPFYHIVQSHVILLLLIFKFCFYCEVVHNTEEFIKITRVIIERTLM